MKIRDLELQLFENDIIFAFSGAITYNMLSTVGETMKEDLEDSSDSKELANMYEIFTEMLQNIMNYSAKRNLDTKKGAGTCFVRQNQATKKFTVCAGNMIHIEDEDKIIKKLQKINSLDKDGLKSYYREIRKSGVDAHVLGAGLGLLTIARKADGNLEYNISKVDNEFMYFEICAKV